VLRAASGEVGVWHISLPRKADTLAFGRWGCAICPARGDLRRRTRSAR